MIVTWRSANPNLTVEAHINDSWFFSSSSRENSSWLESPSTSRCSISLSRMSTCLLVVFIMVDILKFSDSRVRSLKVELFVVRGLLQISQLVGSTLNFQVINSIRLICIQNINQQSKLKLRPLKHIIKIRPIKNSLKFREKKIFMKNYLFLVARCEVWSP